MNVWKLINPHQLVKETEEIPEPADDELKVRITKVLVSSIDASIYDGSLKVACPIVPGRFAVGRIASENGPEGLEKGTRVLLHTFLPEKDTGTAKKDFSADEYGICGQTVNGYMRDFVCVHESDVTALPDSVKDEHALLIELAALAKATVDTLDVQKGQHIAVFGGDMLGLFICQLLIYQQAAPILIDNHTKHLDFAKKCGIYYTSPADDTLVDNVAKLTGGRLADGAIFVTSSGPQNTSLPFKVSAHGTNTVFCGFHGRGLSVDLDSALKKGIAIYGITNGADYIPAAVNLLATKAIDLSLFQLHTFEANQTEKVLESYAATRAEAEVSTLYVAELI